MQKFREILVMAGENEKGTWIILKKKIDIILKIAKTKLKLKIMFVFHMKVHSQS